MYICQIECPYYRCQSICQIRTLFFEIHIFLEFLSYIQQRGSAIFIFSWPHRRCGTSGTSPEALPRRYREGFSADSCDTQPKATVVAKAASHLSPRPLQDLRPWNCLVWRAVPHRLKVHGFSVFFLFAECTVRRFPLNQQNLEPSDRDTDMVRRATACMGMSGAASGLNNWCKVSWMDVFSSTGWWTSIFTISVPRVVFFLNPDLFFPKGLVSNIKGLPSSIMKRSPMCCSRL